MNVKAQREPARHSVVLDCKLVPPHNVPKLACCLLRNVHAVRLAVSPNAKIREVGKNSPTVLSRFWTKVHQIWERVREFL